MRAALVGDVGLQLVALTARMAWAATSARPSATYGPFSEPQTLFPTNRPFVKQFNSYLE